MEFGALLLRWSAFTRTSQWCRVLAPIYQGKGAPVDVDPFRARGRQPDILPDQAFGRLTPLVPGAGLDSAQLSSRGRQVAEVLRLLSPLASATLAGDAAAAGTLESLLSNPPGRGPGLSPDTGLAALLSMLGVGFEPHPECEEAFSGQMEVLAAAFRLDRAAGHDRPQYVEAAAALMASGRWELQHLARTGRLRADVRRPGGRRAGGLRSLRERGAPPGPDEHFPAWPESGPPPDDGPPPWPGPEPPGPGPGPEPPEPPGPGSGVGDLCAGAADLCTALYVQWARAMSGNPYAGIIRAVAPGCVRDTQLPVDVAVTPVAGRTFPDQTDAVIVFAGRPVADADVIAWSARQIQVRVGQGATTGGFSIWPKVWGRPRGDRAAEALASVCGLAFPGANHMPLEDPDVTLHIIYPPQAAVRVDGRSDDAVSVAGCSFLGVEWDIAFPQQPLGWRLPDCIGIVVAIDGPGGEHHASAEQVGHVELDPNSSSGPITVAIDVDVDGVQVLNFDRQVTLTRTYPIAASVIGQGLNRLLIGRSGTLTIEVPCNVSANGLALQVQSAPTDVIAHPQSVTIPGHSDTVAVAVSASAGTGPQNVTIHVSDPQGGHDPVDVVVAVERPTTALALSGGGAKGSFQVGAFAYIARRWERLNVGAVCGISVGAINALAVAEDRGELSARKMQDIWLQLRAATDMYSEQPWLATAKRMIADALSSVPEGRLPISAEGVRAANFAHLIYPPSPDDHVCGLAPEVAITGGADWGFVGEALAWLWDNLFDPIQSYDEVIATYVAGRVMEDLVEAFEDVGNALEGNPTEALFNLEPVRDRLNRVIDQPRLAEARLQVRLGAVDIETGELVWVDEHGDLILGRDVTGPALATPPGPLKDKLIDGALASSAIPGLFRAIELGEADGPIHLCVDGGVRDVLPSRAALALGADTVLAVATGPTGMERTRVTNPLDLAFRAAVDIQGNEIGFNDRGDWRVYGPHVHHILIEPTFLVHTTAEIDPGLVRINIAYGYLRAFDELTIVEQQLGAADASALRGSTDSIIRTRRDIWRRENELFCRTLLDIEDLGLLELIRDLKRALVVRLGYRVDRWGNESVPRRFGTPNRSWTEPLEAWWERWEQHLDHITPREATPWDLHSTPAGREPPPRLPNIPSTLQARLQQP
jgi:NTE family protein